MGDPAVDDPAMVTSELLVNIRISSIGRWVNSWLVLGSKGCCGLNSGDTCH